jgi:hypothetical protein
VFGGFTLRYKPCPDCGASVAVAEMAEHACERERWLNYQMIQEREELESLEAEYLAYLETPAGRFALWDAARTRRSPG